MVLKQIAQYFPSGIMQFLNQRTSKYQKRQNISYVGPTRLPGMPPVPPDSRVTGGCPNSEYWCELGLVLFVLGRCTHFDILNCICHLSDHFSRWIKSVCRSWWSMLEFILRYIMLSSANRRILDWMFSLMSLMYGKKSIGPRTEPCGTPDVRRAPWSIFY